MKNNLSKIYLSNNFEFILLFLSLFSAFFLWDLKSSFFDFRFLIIFFSFIYFIKYFKSLNFKIDYLIISIILFILIHYLINLIFKNLNFDKNIILFSFYLLFSYHYLKFQKIEFGKIFEIISKVFLLIVLFNILLNYKDFTFVENTQSGACGLFTNFSDFNFKLLGENSHFGMVALGAIFCILFSIKENEFLKLKNIMFYILILVLCFSIFSMTLLLGAIISFLGLIFSFNKKNYKYFIIPMILVVFSILSVSLKESCLSRIERINLLQSLDYLNTQKKFNKIAVASLKDFSEFNQNIKKNEKLYQNLNNCLEFNNFIIYVTSKKTKIENLQKQINFNSAKMKNFKNTSDDLFLLQMQTKKLKDKKEKFIYEISKTINQNVYKTKIFTKCNISANDIRLFFNMKIYENKTKDFDSLKILLDDKSKRINFSEKKYKYPNITTQVYQISLLNTFSSIKENPFGWGYNNYSYSHFKYVIDNIVRLNLDTKVDIKKIKKIDDYNVKDNLQDPDVFYLNYNDGRNNFAKLITEFGYFSIVIFIFLIIFGLSKKVNLIEKSFLIPIIGTQLGSGAGYVNGGFLIAIILALIIYRKSVNKI